VLGPFVYVMDSLQVRARREKLLQANYNYTYKFST